MVTYEAEEMRLPTFQPNITHVAVTDHINNYFKVNFGLETNVLRCYKQLENIRIYEIEVIGKGKEGVKSSSWKDISFIDNIKRFNHEDQLILRDWHISPKSKTFPWFKTGWRESVENWVKGEVVHPPDYYLSIYQTFIFPTFKDNWDKQHIIDHYIDKLLAVIIK